MAQVFVKHVSIEIFTFAVVFYSWFTFNKISFCSIKIWHSCHKSFTMFKIAFVIREYHNLWVKKWNLKTSDMPRYRGSHRSCSIKKAVHKKFGIFAGKNLCWILFLIKLQVPATLLKKTPTQVYSCEYCEVFKKTYFEKQLRTTHSDDSIWNSSLLFHWFTY